MLWGYKINAYDWCVARKIVNGHLCKILLHRDDLKILHTLHDAVEVQQDLIDQEFDQEAPLTVYNGFLHDYIGISIDYYIPRKVQITITDYIDGLMEDPTETVRGEY